jgi:uncharacterized protein
VPVTIAPHPDGATLAVRAQPGARKAGVLGQQAGALKVAVTAPPEDGRANDALIEVLKDWLGVKRSQVELLGGQRNRNKVFLIRGVTPERLTALVQGRLTCPVPRSATGGAGPLGHGTGEP